MTDRSSRVEIAKEEGSSSHQKRARKGPWRIFFKDFSEVFLDEKALEKMQMFGGPLLKRSHAKTHRPYHPKKWMHLIFSTHHELTPQEQQQIKLYLQRLINSEAASSAKKSFSFLVQGLRFDGPHVQLLVQSRNRESLQLFLRRFSGEVAMLLTGARKNKKLPQAFWRYRPWSRLVAPPSPEEPKGFWRKKAMGSDKALSDEESRPSLLNFLFWLDLIHSPDLLRSDPLPLGGID